MLTAFKRFFSLFNLLRIWREERALQREMVLSCVMELSDVLKAQAKASEAQALVMQKWMDSMVQVGADEAPTARTNRDVDEIRIIAESMGLTTEEYLGLER